jgi:hypothetical protein
VGLRIFSSFYVITNHTEVVPKKVLRRIQLLVRDAQAAEVTILYVACQIRFSGIFNIPN